MSVDGDSDDEERVVMQVSAVNAGVWSNLYQHRPYICLETN